MNIDFNATEQYPYHNILMLLLIEKNVNFLSNYNPIKTSIFINNKLNNKKQNQEDVKVCVVHSIFSFGMSLSYIL